jgi:hypothetical protein
VAARSLFPGDGAPVRPGDDKRPERKQTEGFIQVSIFSMISLLAVTLLP